MIVPFPVWLNAIEHRVEGPGDGGCRSASSGGLRTAHHGLRFAERSGSGMARIVGSSRAAGDCVGYYPAAARDRPSTSPFERSHCSAIKVSLMCCPGGSPLLCAGGSTANSYTSAAA